jgi:hypothetical protein
MRRQDAGTGRPFPRPTNHAADRRAFMATAVPLRALPAPAMRPGKDDRVASPAPVRRGRSLAGYLVMPRPGDAVKALLMPLTFGLGVLANGGTDGRTLVRALLILIVLEFLVYPARYQWNDVRGFAADQRHPGECDRGRLPGPLSMARARVMASGVVAAARLALAGIVALLPGLNLGGPVLAVIVGVFGVAGAYEALRAAATGRHGGSSTPGVTPALALLWIAVGAGYVVRGLIGLALAMDLREHPATGWAAAITLWAYGVAFVTSRWAVESISFAQPHGHEVSWHADASHAREHLLALTRWLPSRVDPRILTGSTGAPLDRWAVLSGRTPVLAPWNVAVFIAGGAAAITGLLLTDGGGAAVWTVAAVGGGAALTAACLPRQRTPLVGAGAVGLLGIFLFVGSAHPLVALLPWLGVMVAYVHFSAQSLSTMGHLGRVIRGAAVRVLAPLVRLLVGRPTWQALTWSGPTHG